MTDKELGIALRSCRFRAGLKSGELAGILHYDVSFISKVEKGERSPKFSFVVDWLRATNTIGYFTQLMSDQEGFEREISALQTIDLIKGIMDEANL